MLTPMNKIDAARKRQLCETHVTLDGRPANIRGASLPFANVVCIETGVNFDYAWTVTDNIVRNKNGDFRS